MNTTLSCGSPTRTPTAQLLASLEEDRTVLQTMIEMLTRPRVRTCTQCLGKGLLAYHQVCPCCHGYGKTP